MSCARWTPPAITRAAHRTQRRCVRCARNWVAPAGPGQADETAIGAAAGCSSAPAQLPFHTTASQYNLYVFLSPAPPTLQPLPSACACNIVPTDVNQGRGEKV